MTAVPIEARRERWIPEIGVEDFCYWDLNLSPLKEPPVPVITEPSLQPLYSSYNDAI